MPNIEDIRVRAGEGLRRNGGVLFRHEEAWSDGTLCRFSVRDPNRGDGQRGPTRPQTDPLSASLRLLRVHPDDPRPAAGASVEYQGGVLVLGLWGDSSDFTGQAVGVCRLVDGRVYPIQADAASGVTFRLRIEAQDAVPLGGGGGSDLSASANDSHRGYLPPGVQLRPGEVITTDAGDEYEVVPPVQRDSLGDVVGLSWRGTAAQRTPTPANDPTPDVLPAPTPPGTYDGWWDETAP